MTNGIRRITLILLLGGIAIMLGTSVLYRMDNHPMIVQNEPRPAADKMQSPEKRTMPPVNADMQKGGKMGENMMAIMQLMQKMKENPNDVETLLSISNTFAEQNNMDAAMEMLQRARIAAPADERPSFLMGMIYMKAGKFQEAVKEMELSLKLKSTAESHYNIAMIYKKLSQSDKAKEHLQEALKLCKSESLKKDIEAELQK